MDQCCKEVNAHIPDIDDIIKAVDGKKPSEIRELVHELADVLNC